MQPDRLREALRILDECARLPDDPKAQTVARWVRESLRPDGDTPLAARFRGLLSDYALAIVDGDADRQRAARWRFDEIAGALVPDGGQVQ
ncbi:MAG: hypothetical protein IPK27_14425 [Rhodanobacteraceae bacterium]|nr:hypothetical protein [Rhodanobacteraceae bacterium]